MRISFDDDGAVGTWNHRTLPGGLDIRKDVAIGSLTTMGCGGDASWFVEITRREDLQQALTWASEQKLPVHVLGRGSNTLVSDEGFDGLVLQLPSYRDPEPLPDGTVALDAGLDWERAVDWSVENNLGGLECLAGIPGRCGAAPMQNIGAYGVELSDVLVDVRVYDLHTQSVVMLPREACGFGYRTSRFRTTDLGRYIVLGLRVRLTPGKSAPVRYDELRRALGLTQDGLSIEPARVRDAVLALRRSKSMVLDEEDPNTRSVGSFFINPVVDSATADRVAAVVGGPMPRFEQPDGTVKLAAGWLIEQAGFRRGHVDGAAGLSTRHALAIINRNQAQTADIVRFAWRIHQTVRDIFGVRLLAEPILLGQLPQDLERARSLFASHAAPPGTPE
jgi:UDP-N-acetylmuramate dehydrogenase